MFTAVILACALSNGSLLVTEESCISFAGKTEHKTIGACKSSIELNGKPAITKQGYLPIAAVCINWSTVGDKA